MSPIIVHVDMDAFFASIEQRDNPKLRAKPVIVGADPKGGRGRGVVSTCSYEARRFGIHSAMPISIAYRKCPGAVFLPPDMEKYAAASRRIYRIFYDFTPDIEPVSIDEAFLDISRSFGIFGTPIETCRKIKSRICAETGLTASVGLAPTKMAAKIASDLKKPDGLVEVTSRGLGDFLRPLDVGKIQGLGAKCKAAMNNMGIRTIGELAKRNPGELTAAFGKNGLYFRQLANGIDESKVEAEETAKSVSNEVTFEEDTSDTNLMGSTFLSLCEKVSSRLRRADLKGKTITLKIRLEGFETHTAGTTLDMSTNFADMIYREIKKLYSRFKTRGRKVRLIGVKVSNLSPSDFRESLFTDDADKKREDVHRAVEKIKERFGYNAIYRVGTRAKRQRGLSGL